MGDFSYYLGMHPLGALAIIISTVLLYFSFSAWLAWWGQRMYASPSSLDLAVVTVLGAIVGRAILGMVPTVSGGLLALATLFTLESVSGKIRHRMANRAGARHRAVALMVAGKPDRTELRRLQIDDPTLWSVLRGAGVRSPSEVALVILEKSGKFSVIRTGEPIHPAALTGIRRANEVMAAIEAAAGKPHTQVQRATTKSKPRLEPQTPASPPLDGP